MAIASSIPGCHAIFIPDYKPVALIITPGMGSYFTINPEHETINIETLTHAL